MVGDPRRNSLAAALACLEDSLNLGDAQSSTSTCESCLLKPGTDVRVLDRPEHGTNLRDAADLQEVSLHVMLKILDHVHETSQLGVSMSRSSSLLGVTCAALFGPATISLAA